MADALWEGDDPMPSCEPCTRDAHDLCWGLVETPPYGTHECGCTDVAHDCACVRAGRCACVTQPLDVDRRCFCPFCVTACDLYEAEWTSRMS